MVVSLMALDESMPVFATVDGEDHAAYRSALSARRQRIPNKSRSVSEADRPFDAWCFFDSCLFNEDDFERRFRTPACDLSAMLLLESTGVYEWIAQMLPERNSYLLACEFFPLY